MCGGKCVWWEGMSVRWEGVCVVVGGGGSVCVIGNIIC